MINRINLLLRAKNISARQFAEEIGIQPSGMSHILSGRNNPSLDFVTKVIRRYPEIDANWLLLGRGEMYTSGFAAPSPLPQPAAEELASTPLPSSEPSLFSSDEADVPEDSSAAPAPDRPLAAEYAATYIAMPPHELETPSSPDANLERILFIYSDKSFSEYRPRS